MNTYRLQWSDVEGIVGSIATQLQGRLYQRIYAVARGGVIPATMLAHHLGIRRIEIIHAESYGADKKQGELSLYMPPTIFYSAGSLVVDDIVATGATLKAIQKQLDSFDGNIEYAALVLQQRSGLEARVHWGELVSENVWTQMPWEIA